MDVSASAEKVRFDEGSMWVHLTDGRTVGVPLVRFPRLLYASVAEREACEITPHGLHWDELDEDISIEGLLAGEGDRTRLDERARRGPAGTRSPTGGKRSKGPAAVAAGREGPCSDG